MKTSMGGLTVPIYSSLTKRNELQRRKKWGVGLFLIELIQLPNQDCWQSP